MRASLSNPSVHPSDLASEMNCFMNRLNSGGKGAKSAAVKEEEVPLRVKDRQ